MAFLRESKDLKLSQMQAALGFKRQTWSGYENGGSQPALKDFIKISEFFGISEHDLLHVDLEAEYQNGNLILKTGGAENIKKGNLKGNGTGNLKKKNYPENTHLTTAHEGEEGRILQLRMPQVITVDSAGNENVIMVPVRARAGYLNGYADPEFMATLPAYRLPGLNNGTYRLFEVEGLSMYPTLHSGDLVIGSNVDQLRDIRDDRVYVIVTKNDGVVVKRVLNRLAKDGKLILKSDNYKDRDMYPPIVCDPEDILEIWYSTGFISRQMRPPAEVYNRLIDLEGRITLLEAKKLV